MEHFVIEDVRPMRARVRMQFNEFQLRPGGTISGPSLMTLADTGLWVALLAMIGREPLSVTSHLDIDFLRKPAAADVDRARRRCTRSASGSRSATCSCIPLVRTCRAREHPSPMPSPRVRLDPRPVE